MINSLKLRFLYNIHPFLYRDKGTSIFNEDWNNLIILDACRYDYFISIINDLVGSRLYELKNNIKMSISVGTDTTSFLLNTFKEEYYSDIIYITANPFVDRLLKNKFYKTISVWRNAWSREYETVLPSAVYLYALKIIEKYKEKRLIIHFIQPHYPYILQKIKDNSLNLLRKSTINNTKPILKRKYIDDFISISVTDVYKKYDLNLQIVGYIFNLKIVLEYVNRLIDFLPGKTIITSDHGEAFGEKFHNLIPIKIYGHPKNIRMPILTKVPWVEINPEEKIYKDIKDLKKEINKYTHAIESEYIINKHKIKYIIKRLNKK